MDKDHLPLLEDQNPVRRSEIFADTGSAKVALTEAIKSLSNVSGREADVITTTTSLSTQGRSDLAAVGIDSIQKMVIRFSVVRISTRPPSLDITTLLLQKTC